MGIHWQGKGNAIKKFVEEIGSKSFGKIKEYEKVLRRIFFSSKDFSSIDEIFFQQFKIRIRVKLKENMLDLALRGFWLQKWTNSEKAKDCIPMIDHILTLVKNGKLKYGMELVPFEDFSTALDKALGKSGSHPKQVIRF
ncbi:hypothetical protein GW17_00024947 [Ensete ventricosum]|nr:hypothetical protein GW17_00024947 [Ensete ventricosum]